MTENAEETRATVRHLAWYELQNVTPEAVAAFADWQREKRVLPVHSLIESLPNGRRNYTAAFDMGESYRVVWWLEEQKIAVALVTAPKAG